MQSKLIEHLEELLNHTNNELGKIAVDAMENDAPFNEFELVKAQKEYRLHEQYMLGISDAIEEVRTFHEGFYCKNQHIEGRD